MLNTKLIRTLIFTVLASGAVLGLCARESVAQARYPAAFTLKGTSMCAGNLPGCENEIVVYRIEPIAGTKDRFMLYADTLIKGQRVPQFKHPLRGVNRVSGPDFQFQTDANPNQPIAEAHKYRVLLDAASGELFRGTISLTQNNTVVRRLNLELVDPQRLPAAPRYQEYYYLKMKPVLLTFWRKDSTHALAQSDILLQLRTSTGDRFRLDSSASDNVTQMIQAAIADLEPEARTAEAKNLRSSAVSGKVTSIDSDPSDVTVRFDSWAPLKSPINGQPVEWIRDDGVKFELKSWLRDGSLVQTLTAPVETITLTYTPSRKGQTLTIKFRLVKTRLPRPLTYKLVYNRAS